VIAIKKLVMINDFIEKQGFSVIHVVTEEEMKKVYDIRYNGEYWKYWEERNRKTRKSFFSDEQERDRFGTVLAFKENNSGIIGTVRFTSMADVMTSTEEIMKDYCVTDDHLKVSWEIGRLIVVPEKRGQKTLFYFLYLAFKWLVSNKNINYTLAHCPYKVARIYRKFGFKIISKKFIMDYCTQEYVVISGSLLEIIEILEELILMQFVNENSIVSN
jgi:predicted GNAT family N-acyltransferase